nr:S-layer homology domain-containing protein [Paenibacillus sp. GSMTC-2017]
MPFDDISKSYAKKEIINLYNKNILTGTSETSFSPARSVTRAEFITILSRLLALEPVMSPVTPYTDVKQNTWYYGFVQAAVQLELAKGKSATTFAPGKSVTRQEAAVWMARALKQTGNNPIASTVFKDGEQIADWASASVAAVHKLGLIKGDNNGHFRPTAPISRQETAVLIDRVLQNSKWAAELAAKPNKRIVLGWQYGQTTEQYGNSILQSNVNTLSPRWYFMDKTGLVTDNTDTKLVTWAKKNNKQIWAMVGNRFDQEATHEMLSSAAARNKLVNQLAEIAKKYGLQGLNIDFENVASKDRQSFTTFITLLADKLHAQGTVLSIDVSPDLGTDWTEAFDYAALGKQADYMVMMGYDEHYGALSGAGSNASLPYVTNAVNKLLKVVPSNKVILALPFYNRDWTLKQDGSVASMDFISLTKQNEILSAYSLKPVWNESLGQYVADYTKQSTKHTIWFEDGRSLIAKYHFTVNKKLAGVAYWYVGGESKDIWPSLRNAEKYYDYSF